MIGEQNKPNSASTPALKMSSNPDERNSAIDNDRENSKIPNSSFSKEPTYEKRKPIVSPGLPSCPVLSKDSLPKPKKNLRRVSFEIEEVVHTQDSESNNKEVIVPHRVPIESVSPQKKSAKKITFNKRVRIRKIRRLEDMPSEQISTTYFTEQELIGIRSGLRAEIRSLVEQNFQEEQHEDSIDDATIESTFCIRGLEHEFPKGKYKRKQLKMMSRASVLEEQRLQREFFVHNDRSSSTHDTASTFNSGSFSMSHEDQSVAIAEIYRIESKPAVQLALEYAKRDEFVADQIYFAHQAI